MTTSEKTFDIISNHIPFRVKLVLSGDSYGLNNCLTHDKEEPLVEFYDQRYPHTEDGQFISRYYLETLLERELDSGLCLQGDVPDWNISGREMGLVSNWLKTNSLTKDLHFDKQLKLKF